MQHLLPIAQQGKVVTRRDGGSIAANSLLDFKVLRIAQYSVLLLFYCFMYVLMAT
jgi:hypothetical protein